MLLFNQKFYIFNAKCNQNSDNPTVCFGGVVPKAYKPIKELTKDFFAKKEVDTTKLQPLFTEIITIRKSCSIASRIFDSFFHEDFVKLLLLFRDLPKIDTDLFKNFVEAFRRCKVEEGSLEASLVKKLKNRYVDAGGTDSRVIEHCESNFLSVFKKRNKCFIPEEDQIKLINKNQGLIRFVINNFFKNAIIDKAIEEKELFDEGNIGLAIAARYWNPEKKKFSTYAVYWIRHRMRRFLKNQPLIKNGNNIRIISNADMPRSNIYTNGKDCNFMETVEDKNILSPLANAIRNEEISRMRKILDENPYGLTVNEINVLKLYFGFGDDIEKSLKQVAEIEGITTERARQLKERALYKLKRAMLPLNYTLNSQRILIGIKDETKRNLLLNELEKLSEKQRKILYFRFGLNGFPKKKYREIAEEMDLTMNTVDNYYRLGIKHLEENAQFVKAFNS